MDNIQKIKSASNVNRARVEPAGGMRSTGAAGRVGRVSGVPKAAGSTDELARLRIELQRMRLSLRHELELARRLRTEAERFRQETEARACSQANLVVLQARLVTRKEIAALKREISEEIQKLLADIRIIRMTAQEELGAQRKFSDAAKIFALVLQKEAGSRSTGEEEAVSACKK